MKDIMKKLNDKKTIKEINHMMTKLYDEHTK